jgi:hypothetical protein
MVSTSTRSTPQERVAARKLVWVGPLTIVLAVPVNLVVRLLAVSFFGVASSYLLSPLLQSSSCWWPCSPLYWSVVQAAIRFGFFGSWQVWPCLPRF